MGRAVKIKVDQEDIDRAIRSHSMKCVVMQAIARTIPEAHHIDVDIQTIRWTAEGERVCYLTPYAVQGYVVAFDAGDEITPFSFQLDSRTQVPIRQRKRTESGLAVHNAREEVRRAKRQQKDVELTPASRPAEVTKAKTRVARAQGRLDSVKAAYRGQQQQINTTPGTRKAPPRVSRTSRRNYGHRVLRVNQTPRRLVKKRTPEQ